MPPAITRHIISHHITPHHTTPTSTQRGGHVLMPKVIAVVRPHRMASSVEYVGNSTWKKHVCAMGNCFSPPDRLDSLCFDVHTPDADGNRDRPHANRTYRDLSSSLNDSITFQNNFTLLSVGEYPSYTVKRFNTSTSISAARNTHANTSHNHTQHASIRNNTYLAFHTPNTPLPVA